MSTLWLGLIAVFSSVTAPLILVMLTNRQRREEKREDWDRQDAVAAQAAKAAELLLGAQEAAAGKAEEAAELLVNAQAETIRKTDEVALAHKQDNLRISEKLEVIRVDVNSNMTAAMQAELDATEGQLVLMREVVDLKRSQGTKPSAESLTLIAAKEERINELKAKLKDRLTHSEIALGGE